MVLGMSKDIRSWSQQTQKAEKQSLLSSSCLPVSLWFLAEPNRKPNRNLRNVICSIIELSIEGCIWN